MILPFPPSYFAVLLCLHPPCLLLAFSLSCPCFCLFLPHANAPAFGSPCSSPSYKLSFLIVSIACSLYSSFLPCPLFPVHPFLPYELLLTYSAITGLFLSSEPADRRSARLSSLLISNAVIFPPPIGRCVAPCLRRFRVFGCLSALFWPHRNGCADEIS